MPYYRNRFKGQTQDELKPPPKKSPLDVSTASVTPLDPRMQPQTPFEEQYPFLTDIVRGMEKPLDIAFAAPSFVGAGIGYLGEEFAKRSQMSQEEWEAYQKAGTPVNSLADFKKFLPGGEYHKRLQESPFLTRIVLESPFWVGLAKSGISATSLRKSLEPISAEAGLKGLAAGAGRTALAPIAGAEAVTGAVVKYGIVLPITKGITAGSRKAFETALNTGLDKWIATKGRLDPAYRTKFENWLLNNRSTLIEKATNNYLKRKGRGGNAVKNAVDDTIKEIEPLFLGTKPVTPKVTPRVTPEVPLEAPPSLQVLARGVGEAVGRGELKALPFAKGGPLPTELSPKAPTAIPEVSKTVASEIRRTEIKSMLKTPAKDLPKGIKKIELSQELRKIDESLKPAEKKLRGQIESNITSKSLPKYQTQQIFSDIAGSRHLSEIGFDNLTKILERVQTARPKTIGQKKVITPRSENELALRKSELIGEGVLTEESYNKIVSDLGLKTDKYTSKESFITETQARSIIREINKKAILEPLGELKFGKPTPVKHLTSDTYYAEVLGVKPLTEPLELAKVDADLATLAMSNAVDKQMKLVSKVFGKDGSAKLRDLLDQHEEAPVSLTKEQKESFDWFRNLNRTIIKGENEVRRGLGMAEIPYRQAYIRHVPDAMADDILKGLYPIPPGLEYWSQKLVSKKVFNPTEFHRQLSNDLADLYTKDLALATKDMIRIGMKEIHLAAPLKTFNERMGALSDEIPAATKQWVVDFVNQRIKGQSTSLDNEVNRLVTDSGFGGLVNTILKPFGKTLGKQPVTNLAQNIGRLTILSVLGLPRPRLGRLLIRNLFQRTQELALHNPIAVLKGFAFEHGTLKKLMERSSYLKGYTGVEEWPADLGSKVEKVSLGLYQASAIVNARQAMRTTYHDLIGMFRNPKYKDFGWTSPKRTYTEDKDFLYPEEEKLMLEEMELASRATQYQYIGMAMPGIFRNKSLIPLTRLQSWWMNHFFVFHREAAHRLMYGTTRRGNRIPWSKRVNYMTYLVLGGAVLTSMGYGASYLQKVLPHNTSPTMQLMMGLLTYISAGSDREREEGKRQITGSWKAMVPGALALDEAQKLWSGEMPLWQMFFYGKKASGAPPHIPTWGQDWLPWAGTPTEQLDRVHTDARDEYYARDEDDERTLGTPAQVLDWREKHPEVDAYLFVTSRVSTLQSAEARKQVTEMIKAYKLDPIEIEGYEKEFGELPDKKGLPTQPPVQRYEGNRFK